MSRQIALEAMSRDYSLAHVRKRKLGVIGCILSSVNVVVRVFERALNTAVVSLSSPRVMHGNEANQRITHAKALWYPALRKLAWSEQAYEH